MAKHAGGHTEPHTRVGRHFAHLHTRQAPALAFSHAPVYTTLVNQTRKALAGPRSILFSGIINWPRELLVICQFMACLLRVELQYFNSDITPLPTSNPQQGNTDPLLPFK